MEAWWRLEEVEAGWRAAGLSQREKHYTTAEEFLLFFHFLLLFFRENRLILLTNALSLPDLGRGIKEEREGREARGE